MKGLTLGHICGCRVVVHPLFAGALLVAVVLGRGLQFVQAFLLVLLHEGCHGLCAAALHYRVPAVCLYPFGGVVYLDMTHATPAEEGLVALCGPACNLVLAGLCYLPQRFAPLPAVQQLGDLSLAMGLFNLLPLLPLDGGRVLRAALAPTLGYVRAGRAALYPGVAVALLLLGAGVYGALRGVWNVPVLCCGVFLLLGCFTQRADLRAPKTAPDPVLPLRTLVVRADTPIYRAQGRFLPGMYHVIRLVDPSGRLLGEYTEADLQRAAVARGARAACAVLLAGGKECKKL